MLTIIPEPPEWKALLGFDFDGTLHLPDQKPELDPRFFDSIRWIRTHYGAVWGICTGRSLFQLVEGFTEGAFPALPDFIIAREREIYFPGQFGRWVPDETWNTLCEKEHHKLFRKNRRLLKKVRQHIEKLTGARWIEEEGEPAGIVAADENQMAEIVDFTSHLKFPAALSYERNSVYMRFSHAAYNKGTALAQVGKRWGIGREKTLAVGDNYNDLSMLESDICQASGCPGNSVPAVRDFIKKRGGIVANKNGSQGVIEILGRYFDP